MDLEKETGLDIEEWINMNCLESVVELNAINTVRIIDQIKASKLLMFINDNQQSSEIMDAMRTISEEYRKHMVFVYVIDPKYMDLRFKLGI